MKENNSVNNSDNLAETKKNSDIFYSYSTQDKVKYFQSHVIYKPILKLLRIDVKNLNDSALDDLYKLGNNSQKYIEQSQIYNKALELFSMTSLNSLKQNLENSKVTQIVIDKVINIFESKVNIAVKNSVNSISRTIRDQGASLLNPEIALKIVDVFDGIISFKKTVDNNFPEATNSIIDAANSTLLSLVNAQSSIAGNILQSYDLAKKAKEFMKCENLENNSKILRDKIVSFSQDRELNKVLYLSSKLDDLYNSKGINEASFMKLSNNVNTLTKIMEQCEKDPRAVELTKKLIEVADILPSSNAQVTDKIQSIQTSLIHFDQKSKLNPIAQDLIKKIVEEHIQPILEPSLSKIVNGNSLFERATIQQQAISQLSTLTEKVVKAFDNREDKSTAVQYFKEKLNAVVKDNFKQVDNELIHSVKKFPIVAKEIGLSREVESTINKLIGNSRSI